MDRNLIPSGFSDKNESPTNSSSIRKRQRSPYKSRTEAGNMKVLENLTGPELLNQVYGKYEKSDSKIEFFGRYSQNELEGILNNTMEEKHELERCIKKITNFMKSLKGFSIWKTKKLRNCQEEVLVTRNHVHTIDF